MIFPKCMIGRKAFITCHGYVMPCCWIDIPRYKADGKIDNSKGEMIENIFIDPRFDLRNHTYKEIVTSDAWLMSLERLFLMDYNTCNMKCSNFFLAENGKEAEHSEAKIDDMLIKGTLKSSTNQKFFDTNLVDTWQHDILQIELTSRCSLMCPYCPRQDEKVKKADLSLDIVDDFLNCKPWCAINDVGSYGDSVYYPHYHEFLEKFIESDCQSYWGHLAATGRGTKWWDTTTELFGEAIKAGKNIRIFYGVDGLEDTSKIHRIGQNWDEITYAMRKTAEAGCESLWQFIPMSFNEHQIEEAKALSEQWGVKFFIHTSCRFRKDDPNIPLNPKYHRDFYNVRD